jgi:ABC-2 type transport system ATP-binding protein
MTDSTIVLDRVTKRYATVTAVHELSFDAQRGRVTGFLGPNGAGKTTTLRMLLGLARPTSGSATVLGRPYAEIPAPTTAVGALLDANTFHPWRSARNQLRITAAAAGVASDRVEAVLRDVGLEDAAGRRVGGFSLGMRQRLGLAGALLGDPEVLVLDEPTNGLDPEGIRWLRSFLRDYAEKGRTVLVSSHNLAEVEQTVDDVVIIAEGRLRAHCTLAELRERTRRVVDVRTHHAADLRGRLAALQVESTPDGADGLRVLDASPEMIGEVAALGGIPVFGMTSGAADLESLFFELTAPTTATEVPA